MNHGKHQTRATPEPKRPLPQEQAPSYMEEKASAETGQPPHRHEAAEREHIADDGSTRERPAASPAREDIERERHAMPARERDEDPQLNDIRREPPGID